MAKPAYFILLLLVSSFVLLEVAADQKKASSENPAGISSRKFLVSDSLLKALKIEEDSHKEKCIRYRHNCSKGTCCACCYCKYFTLPEGPTPLCDGKIGC